MTTMISIKNAAEMVALAREIAEVITPGDVITFDGDLGTGKSLFCREIIKYWCGDNTHVPSPTFNLVQLYDSNLANCTIYHYDLYRLEHISDLYELGFEEALSGNITLIEWPELAQTLIPRNIFTIKISIINHNQRSVTLNTPRDISLKIS